MKSKGFTLIELMIVVAIIAIIAAIAIPNLLRSRMAANETAAVAACKAFATAENIYRRTDYNQDGVLEYAQTLHGTNSLYETVSGSGDIALIDRSFAMAEGFPAFGTVTPKAGYCFQVLNRDDSGILGGGGSSVNWIDGAGHMTLGYGMVAISNQYDGVGRNTFQIAADGTIYQKDVPNYMPPMTPNSYAVDSSWVVAE